MINQVLEHIHEPGPFLGAIKRVLRPGGVLFVGTRCFWSVIPLVLQRQRWYALLPDEHVWQFSKESLRRLLVSHGFPVIHFQRGCSAFWGKPSVLKPKSWLRYLLYKSVKLAGQGDFLIFVVVNEKQSRGVPT